jgi:hypothetical protein
MHSKIVPSEEDVFLGIRLGMEKYLQNKQHTDPKRFHILHRRHRFPAMIGGWISEAGITKNGAGADHSLAIVEEM